MNIWVEYFIVAMVLINLVSLLFEFKILSVFESIQEKGFKIKHLFLILLLPALVIILSSILIVVACAKITEFIELEIWNKTIFKTKNKNKIKNKIR